MQKIQIFSADTSGLLVRVECQMSNGLPGVQIVGMASKSVDESKERVRAAFTASGITFPKKRVLISLSPSDIQKEGSSFDLAIALAILVEAQLTTTTLPTIFCVGELGLDGKLLPVRGIIGRLLSRNNKDDTQITIIPAENERQASLLEDPKILVAKNLAEVIGGINGTQKLHGTQMAEKEHHASKNSAFYEVRGQEHAKRALEIAAAGQHNVLLYGPPGTGKTMLAKALQSILPDLTRKETIESTQIHSLLAQNNDTIINTPPLRSPHHGASVVAIVGGGQKIKPGEISLAHNGILFFDEMPEFSRGCLEALRQPLEDHQISISRASESLTLPASFIFIATMNPCPCGNLGSTKVCTCSGLSIQNYHKKLSGPLLDRIDLFVFVDTISHSQLLEDTPTQDTSTLKKRIRMAREIQLVRNKGAVLNANLENRYVRKLAIESSAVALLNTASEKLSISPRAYFKILRVAQTIADLETSPTITKQILAEALQFREKPPQIS